MILQLQEKVPLAKAGFISLRHFPRLVDQAFLDIALYLPSQAG